MFTNFLIIRGAIALILVLFLAIVYFTSEAMKRKEEKPQHVSGKASPALS